MNATEVTMEQQFDLEWVSHWAQATFRIGDVELSGEAWVSKLRSVQVDEQDRIYAGMVSEMRAGKEAPLRIILKAMMPRVISLARLKQCSGGFVSRRDRMSHLMTAAWIAIRQTPATRSRRFQAGFSMDIYNHALKFDIHGDTPIDLSEYEIPCEDTGSDPERALTRVLSWALNEGVLERDQVMLLAKEFLGDRERCEVAEEMGISVQALGRRVERATASLIISVQHKYRFVGM